MRLSEVYLAIEQNKALEWCDVGVDCIWRDVVVSGNQVMLVPGTGKLLDPAVQFRIKVSPAAETVKSSGRDIAMKAIHQKLHNYYDENGDPPGWYRY
jgi:hypothetical protein